MELIIELPLLALVEGTLDAANGLTFAGGGIVADVDITINAPVTWSEEDGELTIADGVTVTTDDDFTVGTTTLALGNIATDNDDDATTAKTLTGSGTLSMGMGGEGGGGGISYTAEMLEITTNITLDSTVTITNGTPAAGDKIVFGAEDRVISVSKSNSVAVLTVGGADVELILDGTISLAADFRITGGMTNLRASM